MSNGIYLTLEQYKDKDLPLTITINGHTYHSQFALATTQTTWFEMGKQHGMELGADNTYSDKEMSRMHDAWYEEGYEAAVEAHNITITDDFTKGYNKAKEELEQLSKLGFAKGYEAGKSESYGRGWIEGHNEASIKQFDEYSVKLEERYKSKYDAGYNDGYKQGKHDGISKINLNTEPVEQTELSKEYDKGFTKGYEEGKEEEFDRGWAYGYEAGKVDNPNYMRVYQAGRNDGFVECKRDSISAKEIPGESLAHIEEARLMGYEEGYSDAKEGGQAEGYIDRREQSKPMIESGDEEDGELIGPEQTEYAKGYEDGKAAGYEEGYERGFLELISPTVHG